MEHASLRIHSDHPRRRFFINSELLYFLNVSKWLIGERGWQPQNVWRVCFIFFFTFFLVGLSSVSIKKCFFFVQISIPANFQFFELLNFKFFQIFEFQFVLNFWISNFECCANSNFSFCKLQLLFWKIGSNIDLLVTAGT